jgi:hypothetical protein
MNSRLFASLTVAAALAVPVVSLMSCDPDGKKQCAWFIEYDANRPDRLALEGYVPVCAKNLKNNKQD